MHTRYNEGPSGNVRLCRKSCFRCLNSNCRNKVYLGVCGGLCLSKSSLVRLSDWYTRRTYTPSSAQCWRSADDATLGYLQKSGGSFTATTVRWSVGNKFVQQRTMRNLTARPDCVSADTVDSWPINSKAAHSLISGGKRRNAHMCRVQLPTSYSPQNCADGAPVPWQ